VFETGRELSTLTGHDGAVISVAWSPDGKQILTGSEDITAKVWDAQTERELSTLTGHDHWVSSVSWVSEDKRIATAGEDGLVQIHTTDIDELLQIAESRVTRQLTSEERETYGGEE
jgi:WD40 repeat protein